MKHTQGKWAVIQDGYGHYIEAGDDKLVIKYRLGYPTIDEAYKLYVEIVKTHNSFDGLLEACKEAAHNLLVDSSQQKENSILTKLINAIAKAEAKE